MYMRCHTICNKSFHSLKDMLPTHKYSLTFYLYLFQGKNIFQLIAVETTCSCILRCISLIIIHTIHAIVMFTWYGAPTTHVAWSGFHVIIFFSRQSKQWPNNSSASACTVPSLALYSALPLRQSLAIASAL